MNYFDNIMKRANVMELRAFLLDGAELGEIDSRSYEERLDSAYKLLGKHYTFSDGYSADDDEVIEALAIFQDVYTEIGMRAGAKIALELLCTGAKE